MPSDATAYLDHAATTPMHPEVLDAMQPYFTEVFGNPSGSHPVARLARRAIDEARDLIASVVGCEPREVIFTSGGTEADNQAIFGTHHKRGGTVMCTAVEHHAVLEPVEHLGGIVVGVTPTGHVDLDALAIAVDRSPEPVTIVSVMLVNNEVGTINDLDAVRRVLRKPAPDAVIHTDAVQAAAWLDLRFAARSADLISLSAHKFGGPKGVGALIARGSREPAALLLGGGQERELRSGTHNVAGIVGMATAIALTDARRDLTNARVVALRDRLVDGLIGSVPGLIETVPRNFKVAGAAHVCVPGVESEALLFLLERAGVYATAASSCASGAMEPSHVLAAMGTDRSLAGGALRLTLGPASTASDVEQALVALPAAVHRLRGNA